MPTKNEAWSKAISELLNKHNLTARAAAVKIGYSVSHTYISDWLKGRLPQYDSAIKFLEHFPRDEAIVCLEAIGMPVPQEWRKQAPPRDQLKEALKRMQLSSDGSAEARANAEHIVSELIKEVYGEE